MRVQGYLKILQLLPINNQLLAKPQKVLQVQQHKPPHKKIIWEGEVAKHAIFHYFQKQEENGSTNEFCT